jgi:hypothetical protein
MPPEVVFLTVFLFGGLFWVTRPLIHAFADRVRHRSEPGDGRIGEEVLEELRAMRREMTELAERVDFAERLLAQGRNESGLASPKSG